MANVDSQNPTANARFDYRLATEHDAGQACPHCRAKFVLGSELAICHECGTAHHARCWRARGGCGTFACTRVEANTSQNAATAVIRISAAELEKAVPLPVASYRVSYPQAMAAPPRQTRVNRLAVAAFICALAGIPFFGVVTGPVAVLLGALAIGSMRGQAEKGAGWATAGILLGIVDTVAWIAFISFVFSSGQVQVALNDFDLEPAAAVEDLAPPIRQAVLANVLVEQLPGFRLSAAMGSGVILQIRDGQALIVTNRHVVDEDYDGQREREALDPALRVQIQMFGRQRVIGDVIWMAPDGIDLAAIMAPCDGRLVAAANWQPRHPVKVGESAFAIGNPHGLTWSHTQGTISQLRTMHKNGHDLRIIQTQAAINPGNSGGGLYDKDGFLIGLNTWTNDKRVSEGIGFAISLQSLLELLPEHLFLESP